MPCNWCGISFIGGEHTILEDNNRFHDNCHKEYIKVKEDSIKDIERLSDVILDYIPICVLKGYMDGIPLKTNYDLWLCGIKTELAEYEVCDRGDSVKIFQFDRTKHSMLVPKELIKNIHKVI